MRIYLNGQETIVENGLSILDLLNQKSLPEKATVVELNGKIVKQDQFGAVFIQDNDVIEVLRFVGGG